MRHVIQAKIMAEAEAAAWRAGLRAAGAPLVFTNGCFDLLHRGHAEYLAQARSLGGALAVGLNSDESIRGLKGPSRPILCEEDRAFLLASLQCVDAVIVFGGPRCAGLIRSLRPDIYAKGADYTVDTLDKEERAALSEAGAEIRFISFVPGRSTSALAALIGAAAPPDGRGTP